MIGGSLCFFKDSCLKRLCAGGFSEQDCFAGVIPVEKTKVAAALYSASWRIVFWYARGKLS